MMRMKCILITSLVILCWSCKDKQNYTYAIKDFRKSLQPFLSNVVSKGYVTGHDSIYTNNITQNELLLLSTAENPILRATAFDEILDRSSFDQFDVVINHLDDTAIVAVDNGEFGIGFTTVSDYVIRRAFWEKLQEKNKIIDKVLTRHNYLRSAYTILPQLDAQERYYSSIRDMATRPRHLDYDGYELGFADIEYALYGLAKFRKKGDIQIIKNKLMKRVWELSDLSFRLMKEYPDTAYFAVLQEYHRRQFYKFSGNRPHGFSGFDADRAAPEDFIRALVMQKSSQSAGLLDTMLTNLPKYTCMPDKEHIITAIIEEVWEHPCPAYVNLRKRIRHKAERIFKNRGSIIFDPIDTSVDTTMRKYRW